LKKEALKSRASFALQWLHILQQL